jgi:prepilin-type N-terminal cleavage/methylation domain-containing protein
MKKKNAFALIELLVTVVIVIILASVAVSFFKGGCAIGKCNEYHSPSEQ